MNRFLFIYFLVPSILSQPALARWATPEEAHYTMLSYDHSLHVQKTGQVKETITVQNQMLNETGRAQLAQQSLMYDEQSETLKVISASTLNTQEPEYSVTSEFIEDKPVPSPSQGFNSYRRVLISFPHLQIGSITSLKYLRQETQPPLKNQFSTRITLGDNISTQKATIEILSELGLWFAVHDPESFLEITENSLKLNPSSFQENTYFLPPNHPLKIQLKRPLFKQIVNEPSALLKPTLLPCIVLTSMKDWAPALEELTPQYESILEKPLPPLFQSIVEQTQQEKSLIPQLNQVVKLINQSLHYMGDWRTLSGRLIPRTLETIATSQRADCKDFATITVAILRALGLKAHVALIRRGGYYDPPHLLPSLSLFNHAIVRVQHNHQTYWIDPTNFVSFAQGIFPDIADHWTLVLDTHTKALERTPKSLPQHNQALLSVQAQLGPQGRNNVQGSLTLKGGLALNFTGASLRTSKEQLDYQLMDQVGHADQMLRWQLKPYDLSSRIVQDIDLEFDYTTEKPLPRTTAGPGYTISPLPILERLFIHTQDRVSDLFISEIPLQLIRKLLLKKKKIQGQQSLDCHLDSPWMMAQRTVRSKKQGIEIKEELTVKQTLLSQETLRSQAFLTFQKKLKNCFSEHLVLFE